MRIGIDARWIFKETSGIGMYTRELIRHLAGLDRNNQYTLFFSDNDLMRITVAATGVANASNFGTRLLRFGLFSLQNQLQLPGIIKELQLDIFHSTNYMIPLFAFPKNRAGNIRCITNIHDLIPLMFPHYAPRSRKQRLFPIYHWIMHQVGMRSNIIITGSKTARKDIVRHLHIPPGQEQKVLAIPDGVSSLFKPPDNTDAKQRKNTKKIILSVGRPDPYKNLTGLIKAYAELRQRCRLVTELRLVGIQDLRYQEAPRLAVELGVQDTIVWVGYVPEQELIKEYQNASVFVLPSLYEGFGLTTLEAMACGTPVICSNKGALPEVAGGGALQVQPHDIIGLADAMNRVLTDERYAMDMRGRGLQQASKYTWTTTAKQTLEAYQKVME